MPTGTISCVSDSYDIWKTCEKIWGEELRDLVIKRGKNGGTLVVRPDSGHPPSVVVKVKYLVLSSTVFRYVVIPQVLLQLVPCLVFSEDST